MHYSPKQPIAYPDAPSIFQAIPDLSLRVDPDGTILDINAAAAAQLATDRRSLIGKRIQDSGLSEGGEPFSAALARVAAERAIVTIEYSGGPSGRQTYHEARLVPLAGQEILVLIRDITERRLTENALRDIDAKFRHLADNITDAFWIRSPDMREVHYVSPGFQRIWGRPVDTLYGNPQEWVNFIVPEDRERVVRIFAGLTAEARSLDVEYRITRPDGEIRWIRARGYQVRDAADCLIRNTGIITDITERKRAQEELEAAQRELLEASRRAGMAEIATNVLHNVGNILNSVTVSAGLVSNTLHKSRSHGLTRAAQMLKQHASDLNEFLTLDEKGRMLPAYLDGIAQALVQEQQVMRDELANLTRSIDHIREVVTTQQSHAGRPGVLQPASIRDLVEDALRINGEALLRSQVSVVRDFAPVPVARLDRGRVLQILVNLIGNARDAIVDLPVASRQITVQLAVVAGGDRLRVSVQDEGEGIPAENLLRIFAHGFTTRPHGHGFGLHSCALAAAQMDGTLSAFSAGPGQGATFTLELPVDPTVATP
jgi:PAS domain S-box-containing protein